MGLKKVLAIALFAVSGNVAFAQTEYTPEYLAKTENYLGRLGHGRDSIEARKFFEMYVKNFNAAWSSDKIEDWRECYRPWKESMVLAPYASYNLTNTGGGMRMLTKLMENETDTVLRYVYFKDLMKTDQFRIRNLEKLNAVPKDGGEARIPLSKGSALMWKAHHYHTLGGDSAYVPDRVYRKDSAYQYFVDAFAQIRNENVGTDNEINPGYLGEYFRVCRDLYMSDKEKYTEQFLTDYTTCLETCDKMMAVYKDKDTLNWSYYAGVRNNTQIWFNETGAGSAGNIAEFYGSRIDSLKENPTALKNAIHLMMTNDSLLNMPILYKACRYAYEQNPDFENSIGMAMEAKMKHKRDSAIYYFGRAFDLAKNDKERYVATYQMGMGLFVEAMPEAPTKEELDALRAVSRSEYDAVVQEYNEALDAWRSRQNVAANKMGEALTYANRAGMEGQYLAPVYYSMAQAYRRARTSESLSNAETCLHNAVAVYPAFTQGNNLIETEQANILAAKEGIARDEERRQARLAAIKSAEAKSAEQRKYEEYLRKKKEEEAFWGKK